MRIDHHAYQRATRVAGFGLLLQIAIGLLLLIFGIISPARGVSHNDTAIWVASLYVLPGALVWLGLIIIFHQHKLERLEALEEDELAATKAGAASFFERAASETRVAARRLALMHKWLMPGLSLALAAILVLEAVLAWRYVDALLEDQNFVRTEQRGWAIAICLGVAAVSFIFSRFVAGMAKQQAWQNLRGGAAYMVGNSVLMLAITVGIIFRFFEKEGSPSAAIEWIAQWIPPSLMGVVALEIVLNFILNLYRPRVAGEVPRPAFDSKILSLLATPDSIVRSINEAVNYQFGFDVASSWGYQLLLRSFGWLLALGVLATVLLNSMVVVEPHQQAVKLRFGRIVGDRVYESGLMWKWPWPIETADVHDVTRIRNVHLTATVTEQKDRPVEDRVFLWSEADPPKTDETLDPFIVGSPSSAHESMRGRGGAELRPAPAPEAGLATEPSPEDAAAQAVSDFYSLVDAEIILHYRIRQDTKSGLLDFLRFAPETFGRRQALTDRDRALRDMALAEVSRLFSRISLDDVLAGSRVESGGKVIDLAGELQGNIQAAFDSRQTGVEVVAVTLPMLRPSSTSAPKFEELNISVQARQQRVAGAKRMAFQILTQTLGDSSAADEVLAGIDEYNTLRAQHGGDSDQAIEQRQKVVDLIIKGGGLAAQAIATAETDRWVALMTNKSQAERVQGQLAAYRAAPELYRQLETMKVYKSYLPFLDKYVIAIDPAHISVSADLKKINPILEFAGASDDPLNKKTNQ